MNDNHKHLANTLIEIPKETVARWFKDAQETSMNAYNRIDSKFCELYLELKTEAWRRAERDQNTYNDMYLEMQKTIDLQGQLINHLKMQIQ